MRSAHRRAPTIARMHANLIGGAWVDGADVARNVNPSNTGGRRRRVRPRGPRAGRAGDRRRGGGASRLVAHDDRRSAPRCSTASAPRSWRAPRSSGTLLAREEGKTLPEGIGEATRAGQIFRFYAGEALRLGGERLDSLRPGIQIEVTREPSASSGSSRRGTSRSRSRRGRSRRPSATATPSSSSPPTSCPAPPGRWPTILSRAGAARPASSTS